MSGSSPGGSAPSRPRPLLHALPSSQLVSAAVLEQQPGSPHPPAGASLYPTLAQISEAALAEVSEILGECEALVEQQEQEVQKKQASPYSSNSSPTPLTPTTRFNKRHQVNTPGQDNEKGNTGRDKERQGEEGEEGVPKEQREPQQQQGHVQTKTPKSLKKLNGKSPRSNKKSAKTKKLASPAHHTSSPLAKGGSVVSPTTQRPQHDMLHKQQPTWPASPPTLGQLREQQQQHRTTSPPYVTAGAAISSKPATQGALYALAQGQLPQPQQAHPGAAATTIHRTLRSPVLPTTMQTPTKKTSSVCDMVEPGLHSLELEQSLPGVEDGVSAVATSDINFLEKAFEGIDQVMEALQNVDTTNPLNTLLYEATMLVRNTLNCWTKKSLHDAALESCQESASRLTSLLSTFSASAPIKLSADLEVVSKKSQENKERVNRKTGERRISLMGSTALSFKPGTCVAKLDTVHFMFGKNSVGTVLFDMRAITHVLEIHNGKESLFQVQTAKLGPDHLPLAGQDEMDHTFKASNDQERQRWLVLFDYYRHRTKAKSGLEKLSVKDRAHFFCKNVFKPFSRKFPGKHLEFLFATDRLLDGGANGQFDQQKIGLKHMFRVLKSRGQGKKPHTRDLEIDLSWPHKIKIWRPPQVQDDKDVDADPLKFDYAHHDLIDWKLNKSKATSQTGSFRGATSNGCKVIDIAFMTSEKGKVKKAKKREYEFETALDATRFLNSLSLFQQLEQASQFSFMHQGSVYLLAQSGELLHERHPSLLSEKEKPAKTEGYIWGETPDEGSGSAQGSALMQQHLHWLFCSISESIPLNTTGVELAMHSRKFSLDTQGDAARLYMLNAKFEELMSMSSQRNTCSCESNRCAVLLLKAFYQFRGFVNVHFILTKSRGVLQQLALKVLYHASHLRHMTATCMGKIKDLHSFRHFGSDEAKDKFLERGEEDEFDLYARNPFAWYIEALAAQQEIHAEIIQTVSDLMMNTAGNSIHAQTGKPIFQFDINDGDLLPTLFAAAHSADARGQELCLGLVISLLTNPYSGPSNRKLMLSQRRSFTWIFPFLIQEHSMRPKDSTFLKATHATAAVINPRTPNKKPAGDQTSSVYNLAIRLLRDLLFAIFQEEELEPHADQTKSSTLYKVFMSALDFAGGPFPDVFELQLTLLRQIACKFRKEANQGIPDVSLVLWDKNVWRFLMVCEEMLLYSPVADHNKSFKSTKSAIVWGPRFDPKNTANQYRILEVVPAVLDMLCAMAQAVIGTDYQASPASPAHQKWFDIRVKPEFTYWSMVARIIEVAKMKHREDQIYLHQMAELSMLMTDRNVFNKKLSKEKGWLPLPAYRVNADINIGQKTPLKLDPAAILKEKAKIEIGAFLTSPEEFKSQQDAFDHKLVTDVKELPKTNKTESVMMPSPRSLGIYPGASLFQKTLSFNLAGAADEDAFSPVNLARRATSSAFLPTNVGAFPRSHTAADGLGAKGPSFSNAFGASNSGHSFNATYGGAVNNNASYGGAANNNATYGGAVNNNNASYGGGAANNATGPNGLNAASSFSGGVGLPPRLLSSANLAAPSAQDDYVGSPGL
eukprot:gb/GEZN01000246.1/.p1 GENE.gb/GEZN01000246.1/~~gb/GEZN01000246.1/.p1  ORF type:complete len:1568 (-),score=285.53 gb/GEZN01000246.1/:628-5331(-)